MSLRRKAATGVKWMSSASLVVAALGFLQTIILSRLLSPGDFGLMTMIWVVLGMIQMFVDIGLSNALVQKLDVTPEQFSSAFWVSSGAGLVLAIVGALLAPIVAAAYG